MTHLTGKRIAIIASDYFEEAELLHPRDALREGGAEVKVYSPTGEPIQAMQGDVNPTQKVDVDGSLDDLDVDEIDALVVPGGTVNADHLRTNVTAQRIARKVAGAGKPLAVICHGPWLLVSAGLVEGRRLTSWSSLADDIRNAGGSWIDDEVIVDDYLITSRKPDDLPAFVEAISTALAGARV
jgi:protease I